MMATAVAVLLIGIVFLGPIGLRVWFDVRQARGDAIGADIRARVNRQLRGESLLSVRVTPRLFWRPGRVLVEVPSGYEYLVEAAWSALTPKIPAGYELVVRTGAAGKTADRRGPAVDELPRAA